MEVHKAVVITTRCAATLPRLIKLCPTSSNTALVPFSEALITGKIAYSLAMAQAAGLVVRRLTIKNDRPNMAAAKRSKVAMDEASGNAVAPCG